jgi:hypothetical protein
MDEPQLEIYARSGNLPARTDFTKNKYFAADPRLVKTAEALAIAKTPWTFHFNDMSNDSASPWITMVRTAIFEGDIDGAIAKARTRMKQIQCNDHAAATMTSPQRSDRQIDNGKTGPDRQQVIGGVVDQGLAGQMPRLDVIRVKAR